MSELIDIAIKAGLPSALVIFFVWIGWLREKDLTGRLTKLEVDDRGRLEKLTIEVKDVVAANTKAVSELSKRTCLWTESQRESFLKTMREPEA